MYGHGFATMFLAECYGMSPRPELREKLSKAVKIIVNSQNKEGGWRYQPVRDDADISVTVCQVMALRAARNAGLFVPNETIDRSIDYVKRSQNADGGFMYMIGTGGESDFPRSAAAVVALYSAGIYKGPEIAKGLDYLMQFMPAEGVTRRESYYFYGHYYAVQAMWQAGGDRFAPLVSGHPRRTDLPPARRRLVAGRARRKRMRHGHGLHRSGDSEQLSADFSAVEERGEWRGENRRSRKPLAASQTCARCK